MVKLDAGGSEYGGGGGGEENVPLLPCLVFVHGESYQWNSGNPYDGSVLAHHGQLIVVTLNFRLGILGFLKTGARGSAQGNFGLMDLVAGLHWLRENLPAFGGDPERITLLGHGTGAALANFIAVSPVAKELLHRVVLLSGSGLSPWALQKDPLSVKRRVAEQTGCHGDLVEDDLAPCLRTKPLSELMAVRLTPPRFLPGFAPFVDGTVLVAANPKRSPIPGTEPAPSATAAANGIDATVPLGNGQQGLELADFPDRDLLFGLASTESYLDLSAQDLEFGFNESRRDRILRTYVRNTYYYHLNEIFSTLKNEYTDWERPTQNPLSVRDATLEVLSDGHTAAPLIRVGYLHAATGGNTYFVHFHHQSGERDFPQRSGSVRGEDLPYVLGLPLVGGQPFFPHNYTRQDSQVSRLLMHYIANFARTGDPNGGNHGGSSSSSSSSVSSSSSRGSDYQQHRSNNEHRDDDEDEGRGAAAAAATTTPPFWDTYDSINQLYLELSSHPEMRSHYRGHKMSLWLNLIPQLHRPGGDDLSMRHHHFQEEGAQFYEGPVRPQTLQRPNAPPPNTASPSSTVPPSTTSGADLTASTSTRRPSGVEFAGGPTPTTECPPNSTSHTTSTSTARQPGSSSNNNNNNNSNLLRKLANSHYQSYTTALTVTIAVGCFLLLLNILIFAGIYHQRDRAGGSSGAFGDKKKEELAEAGSCSSSSGDAHFDAKHGLMPMSASQTRLSALVELPLQEFKSSPPSGRPNCTSVPPGYGQEGCDDDTGNGQSPSIPEPPPPPKNQPPVAGGGILRQQGGSTTPGSMKKRVQIQEISV